MHDSGVIGTASLGESAYITSYAWTVTDDCRRSTGLPSHYDHLSDTTYFATLDSSHPVGATLQNTCFLPFSLFYHHITNSIDNGATFAIS